MVSLCQFPRLNQLELNHMTIILLNLNGVFNTMKYSIKGLWAGRFLLDNLFSNRLQISDTVQYLVFQNSSTK